MKKMALALACCLLLWPQSPTCAAAPTGRDYRIPFVYENGFIVVEVVLNEIFPLRFIFDTGAEHTILTRREITDWLQVNYQRRFTIMGADLTAELTAYLATGISLKISNLQTSNRSILVLEEDYFRIDEFAGLEIHGILGADIFRRYVVQINYRRQMITLHDPVDFDLPRSKFTELPMELNRNKPYLFAQTYIKGDTALPAKYLLDTGASLAVLLYTDSYPKLDLPERVVRGHLGIGLGGQLRGFVGRIQALDFGAVKMNDVVANYQEITPLVDSVFLNNRNGLIGNEVLSRFNLIIDYIRSRCYVSPNRSFKKQFRYDRSGLLIAAGGANLNEFNIFDIVPGSPADEAGLLPGDRILRINGWPAPLVGLEGITRRLKKREGKRIKLIIERESEKLKMVFRLRKLI